MRLNGKRAFLIDGFPRSEEQEGVWREVVRGEFGVSFAFFLVCWVLYGRGNGGHCANERCFRLINQISSSKFLAKEIFAEKDIWNERGVMIVQLCLSRGIRIMRIGI